MCGPECDRADALSVHPTMGERMTDNTLFAAWCEARALIPKRRAHKRFITARARRRMRAQSIRNNR